MQELTGEQSWHSIDWEGVAKALDTDIEFGLTLKKVKTRHAKFGDNIISVRKKRGSIEQFLIQFKQPLVFILIAAGAMTAFLQEWVDSSIIFGVVVVNAVVGFVQEYKASKAMQSLIKMVASENIIVREGKKIAVPSKEIVPGDIVILRSGDKVPADIRLCRTKDLKIDESVLTGESLSSQKDIDAIPQDTVFAERKNMAYCGTLVTNGYGIGIVVLTGDRTEAGKISKTMYETQEIETPLTRKIAQFSRTVLVVILSLSVLTFILGWYVIQRDVTELFMEVVALAVAAIPEGLPAAITITLAIGVNHMAKKHAVVRKLSAVETLGSTTVICSDKTGTITENQMTVSEIYAESRTFYVSGTGYNPTGKFTTDKGDEVTVKEHPGLIECLTCGLACNDSDLILRDEKWSARGDPTEVALIVSAFKAGVNSSILKSLPRIDSIPFESHLQFMATLHQTDSEQNVIYVKGAVERILDMCSYQTDTVNGSSQISALSELETTSLCNVAENMAANGLRVLAFAKKDTSKSFKEIEVTDVESELIFLGFQAMLDPPRPEVIEAVRECKSAGITIKMITGDSLNTAMNIGEQIGLGSHGNRPSAITGKDLEAYSDEELIKIVEKTDIFARVLPDQKFALVRALQSKGNIVAMTGDGVNDAPALKQADIGIAMGVTGTEAAKEASDIILTDDNFASIKAAVEEGRKILDTLIKFIVWTLPTNFGEGLIVLVAVFAGMTLPIMPVQILWVNMTTTLALGTMLIFEPKESDTMKRPPRNPKLALLTPPLMVRMVLVSSIIMISAHSLYQWELESGRTIEEARTVAVNTVVMIELFYLFNCRVLNKSVFSIGLFSNKWILFGVGLMLSLQAVFTYVPIMNEFFHTQPISLDSWLKITGVAVLTFTVIEVEKRILKRFIRKPDHVALTR
ncbi:MAG: HAD-IC family P-type ATPase [Candidatus Nitrosotenuis sp.]